MLVGGNDCKLHSYHLDFTLAGTPSLIWKDVTKNYMAKDYSKFDSPVARVIHDEKMKTIIVAADSGLIKVLSYDQEGDTIITTSGQKQKIPVEFRLEFAGHVQ
jgi:hypothetical protein